MGGGIGGEPPRPQRHRPRGEQRQPRGRAGERIVERRQRARARRHRHRPDPRGAGRAPAVVAVLVGERDAGHARQLESCRLRAPLDLAGAESGIQQDGDPVRFEGEAVAPGARSQHEQPHHPPVPLT